MARVPAGIELPSTERDRFGGRARVQFQILILSSKIPLLENLQLHLCLLFFVGSFFHFIHQFTHSLVCSFVHSSFIIHSFIHWSIHSFILSFAQSPVHSSSMFINPNPPAKHRTQQTSCRTLLPIGKILNGGCKLASQGPYWFVLGLQKLKLLVHI